MQPRLLLMLVLLPAMSGTAAEPKDAPAAEAPRIVGRMRHPITESSGMIASRRQPGVFWTHNDSGHSATLYAVNRDGMLLAEFPVAARHIDWEDIAIDAEHRLYIADIGNNNGKRKQVQVYQVLEPDVPQFGTRRIPPPIKPLRTWTLEYPGDSFDAESLVIHDKHGYIISKRTNGARAVLFRFSLADTDKPITLERVGMLPIRFPVTAADISPDGARLAVLTAVGLYVFQIDGNLAAAIKATPRFTRLLGGQIEACCFVPGGILVTAERGNIYLFPDP